MSLMKVLKTTDELVFEVPASPKPQHISVFVTDKAGRSVVLKITADKSIPIKHYRQKNLGQ
jgi:hypothetical protein